MLPLYLDRTRTSHRIQELGIINKPKHINQSCRLGRRFVRCTSQARVDKRGGVPPAQGPNDAQPGGDQPTGSRSSVNANQANPVYRKIRIQQLQRKRKGNAPSDQPHDEPHSSTESTAPTSNHADPSNPRTPSVSDQPTSTSETNSPDADSGRQRAALPTLSSHNRVFRLIRIKELQLKFRLEQEAKLPARIRRRMGTSTLRPRPPIIPPPPPTTTTATPPPPTASHPPKPTTHAPSPATHPPTNTTPLSTPLPEISPAESLDPSQTQAPTPEDPPATSPAPPAPPLGLPKSDLIGLNPVERLIRRKKIEHRRRMERRPPPGGASAADMTGRMEGTFVDIFAFNQGAGGGGSNADEVQQNPAFYARMQQQFPDLDVVDLVNRMRPHTPRRPPSPAARAAAAAAADDAAAANPAANPAAVKQQMTQNLRTIIKGFISLGVAERKAVRLASAEKFNDLRIVRQPDLAVVRLASLAEILGLAPDKAADIALRQPNLLARHPESLSSNLDVLQEVLGADRQRARQVVAKCPSLLDMGSSTLTARLEDMAAALGMPSSDVSPLARAFPQLLTLTPSHVESQIAGISRILSISREAAVKVVTASPTLLALSLPAVESKWVRIATFAASCERWQRTLTTMPASALARCCIASHAALDRLEFLVLTEGSGQRKGREQYSLSTLLAMSQQRFIDKFPDYMFWARMRRQAGAVARG